MKKIDAIYQVFNTEGYPPLKGPELIAVKRDDVKNGTKHFQEVAEMCAEFLGVELDNVA